MANAFMNEMNETKGFPTTSYVLYDLDDTVISFGIHRNTSTLLV